MKLAKTNNKFKKAREQVNENNSSHNSSRDMHNIG